MEELRKVERKRKRFSIRLKTSKGITCTDTPSPNVVLCNVGQATGFDKESLLQLISQLPENVQVSKFIAEKGESYSFVVFNNGTSAKIFFEKFNGKSCNVDRTVVYMSYVEDVPKNEVVCPAVNPQGLHLLENFISDEEEMLLINLFDWVEEANLKNRQVKHYGYEFRYGSNDVDLSAPLSEKIPPECDILWQRIRESGFNIDTPDQLTVNKYSPGQGIPSHVDRHSPFGYTILSLSLGSQVVMDWKRHSGEYIPVVVPARSLLIMTGEARYDWQHGIQPRTWDPIIEKRLLDKEEVKVITSDTEPRGTRISLTFRKTRQGPCECGYKVLCDSSGAKSADDIDGELASNLEELHVHQVYEQIAGHFSSTRHKPWPKVIEFLKSTPVGSIVFDLGAGNGKNILKRTDIAQIACERSVGLVSECGAQCAGMCAGAVRLDILTAPLCDARADRVICIAVIHHFSSHARRLQAVGTIARLLRPGGLALITVWAKDQKKSSYLCKSKENQDPKTHATVGGLNLPVHENRTQFQHNDLLVPWRLRRVVDKKDDKKCENKLGDPDTTLLRYYHVFEEGELDKLCGAELVVEQSFFEEGNWCVICRKV
ncbi:alkylated DNA repair protein alkB homolog 8 [Aricia agestis]|uniref:alkylated DNA repair protein alkB homolog 8 n=1 Tax=Aricia agestis TaxID=91739 RepID=UPI001C2027D1|nr:alkylated DNA repair protein alkB homolog 8 [Aricia agestis]